MKKLTRKQTIIAIVAASLAVIIIVTFGCVFGITHTVTLDFGYSTFVLSEIPEEYRGGGLVALAYIKNNMMTTQKILKSHIYKQVHIPTDISYGEDNYGHAYDFVGWYYDYGCTVPFLSTDKITSDIILYAKWVFVH